MSKLKLFAALALVSIGIVAAPLNASGPPKVAVVADWDVTPNLTALGFSPRPNPAAGVFNSDLAFWGDYAFQGTYDGFRIVDITKPQRPKEVLFQPCNGNQGDIVVWGKNKDKPDLLVRSYNTPAPAPPRPRSRATARRSRPDSRASTSSTSRTSGIPSSSCSCR